MDYDYLDLFFLAFVVIMQPILLFGILYLSGSKFLLCASDAKILQKAQTMTDEEVFFERIQSESDIKCLSFVAIIISVLAIIFGALTRSFDTHSFEFYGIIALLIGFIFSILILWRVVRKEIFQLCILQDMKDKSEKAKVKEEEKRIRWLSYKLSYGKRFS